MIMNALMYYHCDTIQFPETVKLKMKKLESGDTAELFPHIEYYKRMCGYELDCFYADGKPVVFNNSLIYPCYAPYYLGIPVPSSMENVPSRFSRCASLAAMQWLEKLFDDGIIEKKHFDGGVFVKEINGTPFQFCFPATTLHYTSSALTGNQGKRAAVITIADVSENNEIWEKGTIPYFAEVQARLLQWCWDNGNMPMETRPTDCFIVRITGNTPGDITVRTVRHDPAKNEALVQRLCQKIQGKANPAAENRVVIKQASWQERKQNEYDNAYTIDDESTYKLVKKYMETRTLRKTLEKQSKQIKDEMDSIAVQMAAETGQGTLYSASGTVTDSSQKFRYVVMHTKKQQRAPTVSAGLVQQFYPEYTKFIRTDEIERGYIAIEAD